MFIVKLRDEGFKINSKIILKTLVSLKRIVTFAPAKRKRGGNRKSRNVHRHIELTAVSIEISEHIKRVSELRLKRSYPLSKNTIRKYQQHTMKSLILAQDER
jgi:hypothetical protein